MERRISRQRLYQWVWAEPITAVSPRFDVSDVSLAKVCKRNSIPIPPRGYWASIKAGRAAERRPLPPRELGRKETIVFGKSAWNEREDELRAVRDEPIPPLPAFTEQIEDVILRVTALVGRVAPARNLELAHPSIERLLADDKERVRKQRNSTFAWAHDGPFFASPFEQRRLRLVNSIFKALTRVGVLPSTGNSNNPDNFTAKVGDITVSFSLGKPNEERHAWRTTSPSTRSARETMTFEILWPVTSVEGISSTLTDLPGVTIEKSLAEMVIAIVVSAEWQIRASEHAMHQHRVETKARLVQEELDRIAEIERVAREERLALENSRLDRLIQDAASLRTAREIRSYVRTVQRRRSSDGDSEREQRIRDWSVWALEQADRMDPTALTGPQPQWEET